MVHKVAAPIDKICDSIVTSLPCSHNIMALNKLLLLLSLCYESAISKDNFHQAKFYSHKEAVHTPSLGLPHTTGRVGESLDFDLTS